MKEIELIEKRKPREKHFLREDGTFVAKIYNDDIHYKKDNKYEEIDNTLIKENDYYYNKSNDFKVKFKENSNDFLMSIEKDDNYLNIKLKESYNSHLTRKNLKTKFAENILYSEILDDIDIEYKTLPTKVKETIILKNNHRNKFSFVIYTNLQLFQKNSCIIAKNGSKEIFQIDPPYMEDSNGNINNNSYYNLNIADDFYELELILDSNWLDSADTKYPIYVDPTITNINQSTGLSDTYIFSGDDGIDRNKLSVLKAGPEKVNEK